jgi:hypothetical protein
LCFPCPEAVSSIHSQNTCHALVTRDPLETEVRCISTAAQKLQAGNAICCAEYLFWECLVLFSLTLTRSSVVGSGTMLQAGRSWVRILMRSLDF